MEKIFYEYTDVNGHPLINRVSYASTAMVEVPFHTFLIYAENEKEALKLAYQHVYNGLPLRNFFGTFNQIKYCGEIKCIM